MCCHHIDCMLLVLNSNTYSSLLLLLVAYDTTYSESELKCLGGCEGVAEVTDKVVVSRDYDMLDRMLKVVEKKKKSKFDVRSCQKLLQMLVRSRSQNALSSERVAFVNKILCGLSPSLEPDDQLYAMILSVVDKFGHDNITSGISTLLHNATRKKDHDLSFFLQRAQFILTLNKTLEAGSRYLRKSISDLSKSGTKTIGYNEEINPTIFSMIKEHGWEDMASVVQAALSFMHRKVSVNKENKTVEVLLNRAELIWKLHDYPCSFIQSCLVNFSEDFRLALNLGSYTMTNHLKGARQKVVIKAIYYLMVHGTDNARYNLGSWAISSKVTLSTLLTAITTHSTELEYDAQTLLRDILNKCLIPYSNQRSGWTSQPWRIDQTIDPSLHIQRVLKDHPNLPQMVDGVGRISLHYAAAGFTPTPATIHHRTTAKFAPQETIEHILKANPAGASVRDPITGIYPFMLTAVSDAADSVSSTFSLLLANPSLVMSGIQGEVDTVDNRKRKRSESMG